MAVSGRCRNVSGRWLGWVGKQIWERYPKKNVFFFGSFPYLNVTFTDNELVEEKEGEDDRHGHGDEAQLVGVHRPLIINSSFSIIMRIGHLHRLLSQLLSIVNILP